MKHPVVCSNSERTFIVMAGTPKKIVVPEHIVDEWLPDATENVWFVDDVNDIDQTGVYINLSLPRRDDTQTFWISWVNYAYNLYSRANNKPSLISFDPTDYTYWCLNAKRHRTDGPAVERHNGEKEFWIHDEFLTPKKFWNHPLVVERVLNSIIQG